VARWRVILVSLLAAAALFAGTASAGSPRQVQYGNPLPATAAGTLAPPTTTGAAPGRAGIPNATGGTPAPVAVSGHSLPFTGLDLTLFVTLGGALVACGFLARRLGRRGG